MKDTAEFFVVKYKQQFKEHTTQVECVRNIHRDGWVGKEKRRFKTTHELSVVGLNQRSKEYQHHTKQVECVRQEEEGEWARRGGASRRRSELERVELEKYDRTAENHH